jgi:two-component system OmpR family response regulator
VLIVDDEPGLTELLSVAVTEAGRRPYPAADGHSALRIARDCAPHAVVLDGMLPDLDGIQVLRRLRYEHPKLPVLMLAARDALESGIDGLQRVTGGDDLEVYISSVSDWLGKPERCSGRMSQSSSCPGAERQEPSARVACPSGRLSVRSHGLTEEGARRRLGARRACDTPLQNRYVQLIQLVGLRRKIDKGWAPMIHTVRGQGYAIRSTEDGR